MVEAVKRTKSTGSSTCVVLLLNHETKKLYATYVGDSLYMICRFREDIMKFDLIHKSNEQQHKFNQPYQVGTNGDSPNVAIMESHDVQDKDLIIVASDGLWDNLYDEQILKVINEQINEYGKIKDCSALASTLAYLAEKQSLDVNYESPFAKRAKSMGIEYFGGKEDDITIVVEQIDKIKEKVKELETSIEQSNNENHKL